MTMKYINEYHNKNTSYNTRNAINLTNNENERKNKFHNKFFKFNKNANKTKPRMTTDDNPSSSS